MGLTIHYKLAYQGTALGARRRLPKLQRHAAAMDFECVEPIQKIAIPDDKAAWSVGMQYLDLGEYVYHFAPLRGWYFEILPAEGSEWARFGLAEYPKTILDVNNWRVRTRLAGWCWHSSCKTQYASNPDVGGFDNFRRAHVGLIELFDRARELGIAKSLHDEGRYAEHRDVELLRGEIGQWNGLVAGFVGTMKDALPGETIAPILDYPNFERLEAEGRAD